MATAFSASMYPRNSASARSLGCQLILSFEIKRLGAVPIRQCKFTHPSYTRAICNHTRFKVALKKALADFDINKIENARTMVPPKRLIDPIAKHYEAGK